MEMRSCGTQPRKWKYRREPYFRGTKWEYFFIWTFQQSVTKWSLFGVTKWSLLLLVVQYRVCFYLRVRKNNLMILLIYPIWGGGKESRWEETGFYLVFGLQKKFILCKISQYNSVPKKCIEPSYLNWRLKSVRNCDYYIIISIHFQ